MQAENHDANSAIRQLALFLRILLVRVEGLEPTHLAALDPKSSVSTNFTTPALFNAMQIYEGIVHIRKFLSKKKRIFFSFFSRALFLSI